MFRFVLARPEEGLSPGHVLYVVGVDPVPVQHLVLLLAEVIADRAHHAYVREVARREREVHGGTTEHALALAKRGLDGVEGNRADHYEAHAAAEASR